MTPPGPSGRSGSSVYTAGSIESYPTFWGRFWMRDLMNVIHNAVRQLKKSAGLTTIVIITLALAIGANTTIFSIVDAVMLRPLPYAKPQELVEVQRTNRGIVEPSGVSYPEFFDWRLQNHTLDHLVSYHDKTFTLTSVARAEQLDGEVVMVR